MIVIERKLEATLVARALVDFAEKLKMNNVTMHGEYYDIIMSVAFIFNREKEEHCYELDEIIRKHIKEKYECESVAYSDELQQLKDTGEDY